MENPNRSFCHSLLMIAFGILIGTIPGLIHVDQMRRELQAQTAQARKLGDEATRQIGEATADVEILKAQIQAQHADCQNVILGDGARTILVDVNHPYGPSQQTILGVNMTLPFYGGKYLGTGPIWVIPRAITPHVVDGVLGAAYTHIWPDGRTDGWKVPARAE